MILDDRRCFPLSMAMTSSESAAQQNNPLSRYYRYQGAMVLPVPFGDGECEGAGVGVAFFSLCDGALHASMLLPSPQDDDSGASNNSSGTINKSSSSSSSSPGSMQLQLLPCGLMAGLGDGQGSPCVLSVAVGTAIDVTGNDNIGTGEGGGGVWMVTHDHRRSNSRSSRKGDGGGGTRSSAVVFLPPCAEGHFERSSGGRRRWSRDMAAGGLMRRLLGLTCTDNNHTNGIINNNNDSSAGSERQMSLAVAMQEVMLRMQTLASQQEGATPSPVTCQCLFL